MKSNIIKEIWKIRGKISVALDKKDIELFNQAKCRFNEIFHMNKHLKTISTMTAGREYETQEELDYDRETNFAMLAYDLNRKRKDVLDINDNNIYNIQMSSPIEVLWYTREMFDEFILNAERNRFTKEENDQIYNAITINLQEILECYVGFYDKTSMDEKTTLLCIQLEVKEAYKKYYGNIIDC